MDNKSKKINQLARLLFDKASNQFYGSMSVELFLGFITAFFTPKLTSASHQYAFSVVSLVILAVVYLVKKNAEMLHSDAETMRRQSVFSQALGWGIDKVSYQLWKEKADKKTLQQLELVPLPNDYYDTKQTNPAKKLLEMTNESSFWSMHFNRKAKTLFLFLFGLFVLLTTIILFALPYIAESQLLAQSLVLLIPTLLSIDSLGIIVRLHSNEKELLSVYCETTKILSQRGLKKDQALAIRWASEYNCLMANRVPMFSGFYSLWHDEIQKKWKTRND